jgi:hypothetical protein
LKDVKRERGSHPRWYASCLLCLDLERSEAEAEAGMGAVRTAGEGVWNELDQRVKRNLSKGRFESER